MKKSMVFSLLCILFSQFLIFSQAEKPFDPEAALLRIEIAEETERLQLLIQLGIHFSDTDRGQSINYGRQALELAQKLDEKELTGKAWQIIGNASMELEDLEEARDSFRAALAVYSSLGHEGETARSNLYLGTILRKLGQFDEALAYAEKALNFYAGENNLRGISTATQYLALICEKKGEYERAIDYYQQSLKAAEESGNLLFAANTLNNIGSLYSAMKNYQQALQYSEKAYKMFSELGNKFGIASSLGNIGSDYWNMGEKEKAVEYYNRALPLAREIGNKYLTGIITNNIGLYLLTQDKYDEALASFHEYAALSEEIQSPDNLATAYKSIGKCYNLIKKPEVAAEYFGKSLKIAEEHKLLDLSMRLYQRLSSLHENGKDYKKALEYYTRYDQAREELFNREKNQAFIEVQEKYESEKKEEQIRLLAQQNEILNQREQLQKMKLSRTQLQLFLGLALILLLVALVALFFRRFLYLLAFWKKRQYIGHFRLEEEIASGGMGVVYRAKNLTKPDSAVALKVLRAEMALDERQRRRFIQEGNIIDELDHPNIVRVYERGENNRRLYIAMEFLDGKPLAQIIREAAQRGEQIPLDLCLHLMRQIISGLTAVHEKAVIHRDLNPANIIITKSPEDASLVKLVDFGIAKSFTVSGLTETGGIIGTLNYLSPETISHQEPGAASDIFSLGVVFYEMLTLEKPFFGADHLDIVKQILEKQPLPPAVFRADMPKAMDQLVMNMLEKEPGARPSGYIVQQRLAGLRLTA